MGDGKLQIDQRLDRVESAIRILANELQDPALHRHITDKIEETLKGGTPVVAQES
jgi:hypothetical protein